MKNQVDAAIAKCMKQYDPHNARMISKIMTMFFRLGRFFIKLSPFGRLEFNCP